MNFDTDETSITKETIGELLEACKGEPVYPELPEFLCKQALGDLARLKLAKRYDIVTQEIAERLEHELDIITEARIARKFLVFYEFVSDAREAGIECLCMGVPNASLVFYAIGFTDVDPIKHGLYFERYFSLEQENKKPVFFLEVGDCQEIVNFTVNRYPKHSIYKDKWGADIIALGENREVEIYVSSEIYEMVEFKKHFEQQKKTLQLIKERHGKEIDLWKLPTDDILTFALFANGDVSDIIQFGADGMKEVLHELKTLRFDDIMAMIAMYRPGPMDNIDTFIKRKQGREEVDYLHPLFMNAVCDTYGVIVYQEQVMRIAHEVGGFSLGLANEFRKAIGKKQTDKLREFRLKFINGAVDNGVNKKTAKDIYEMLLEYGCFGFAKSHAAHYAHLAYQSAYLKAHYPREFEEAAKQ